MFLKVTGPKSHVRLYSSMAKAAWLNDLLADASQNTSLSALAWNRRTCRVFVWGLTYIWKIARHNPPIARLL